MEKKLKKTKKDDPITTNKKEQYLKFKNHINQISSYSIYIAKMVDLSISYTEYIKDILVKNKIHAPSFDEYKKIHKSELKSKKSKNGK